MRNALIGMSLAVAIRASSIEGKYPKGIVISKGRPEGEATICDTTQATPETRCWFKYCVYQGPCFYIALSIYRSLLLIVYSKPAALEHRDAFENAF